MKDLQIDTKILNIFGGNIDATQVVAVRNLIQQEVRGAIDNFADHLYVNKILLDFMNKDDIVVDFLSNYKVEDRLDQLRKGKG